MRQDDHSVAPAEIRVWDPFVRVAHWVVAAGFFIAYIVEDEPLVVHVWAGYVVGGLALLRVAWGFVGPKHARFADFVYGPRAVGRYFLDLVAFRATRYIGHSPAGGAMVVALLAALLAVSVTGTLLYGAEDRAGPAASLFAETTADAADDGGADRDHDDDRERGDRQGDDWDFLEDLHEILANLTLALVIAHVAGVLLASVVHRENLPRAMITGRKRAP